VASILGVVGVVTPRFRSRKGRKGGRRRDGNQGPPQFSNQIDASVCSDYLTMANSFDVVHIVRRIRIIIRIAVLLLDLDCDSVCSG
jgi:hypothetical protein